MVKTFEKVGVEGEFDSKDSNVACGFDTTWS